MEDFRVNIGDETTLCISTLVHTALRAPKLISFCRKRKRYSVVVSRGSSTKIKNVRNKNINVKRFGNAENVKRFGLSQKNF